MQLTSSWDKTSPKSDRIDHQNVTFKNRYGITSVGDLYLPKNRGNGRLPAIAVGGPFGAVIIVLGRVTGDLSMFEGAEEVTVRLQRAH